MLKRKIDNYLTQWKNNRKNALIVYGARQIGKSYSIRKFIRNKENFDKYIEINFAERTNLIDTFATIEDSNQLLVRLSAIEGQKMVPYKTIIFFDEIQLIYTRRKELKENGTLSPKTQDILTAMKALVEDGRYRFILSGSLLGILINDVVLNPTGYVDEYKMYPLDFEEFLWAKNVGQESIEYVKNCFINKEVVDEEINSLFHAYFKEYVLLGGMPEAVKIFKETLNLHLVDVAQQNIIKYYNKDITTYISDEGKRLRVREIFKAIPSELNSRNKRYMSTHVVDINYLKRNSLDDEFLWLTNAGVAIPTYNVTEAILPLHLASERKTMKLFMSDIGLLDSQLLSTGIRQKIIDNEKVINYGAPYENVVAQELVAHGFDEELFYYNSKKHGEVDFIVEYNNDVLPIEIKSGKADDSKLYNHSALNNLIDIYKMNESYVFGDGNFIKENENIYQFPIYMIDFLRK